MKKLLFCLLFLGASNQTYASADIDTTNKPAESSSIPGKITSLVVNNLLAPQVYDKITSTPPTFADTAFETLTTGAACTTINLLFNGDDKATGMGLITLGLFFGHLIAKYYGY